MAIGSTPTLRVPPPPFPAREGLYLAASASTPFFLCNTDATTVNTDEPYSIFGRDSTATYQPKVLIVPVPQGVQFFDLHTLCPGTTAPSAAATIKVYGLIPGSGGGLDAKATDASVLPGYNTATTGSLATKFTDLVVPLEDPATGEYSLTFTKDVPVLQSRTTLASGGENIGGATTGLATWCQSKRRTVFVAGASFVATVITSADNRSGSMIVGRFLS